MENRVCNIFSVLSVELIYFSRYKVKLEKKSPYLKHSIYIYTYVFFLALLCYQEYSYIRMGELIDCSCMSL